jgi:hypothetical protein
MPRRIRLAILSAFLFHGMFILSARYRLSYDAYTHMLFANHYAENWFSLWETRWYAGFTVVSYPPLIHQLTALFIPTLGFDAAFGFMMWMVMTLYPLGIYAFSRIFIGKTAASYSALVSALLLPMYVTAHIFGQLPFLSGTLIALFGAASFNRYLREGGIHNFLLSVLLATTSMAAHHATLLVQPFLIFAVVVNSYWSRYALQGLPLNIKNLSVSVPPWLVLFLRLSFFIALATLTSILVSWPFWQWGMQQAMQTPIDHPSRHNFFSDPLAPAIFFWPIYGPLVVIIPILFRKWPLRFLGLLISFIILFILGLGGTTRLPHLFFGDAWEWLTYDRFAFWACLTLTPFFGILFLQLKWRWVKRISIGTLFASARRSLFTVLTFSVFIITVLGAWLTPFLFATQPKAIDMQPIVDFLSKEDRSQWRYLTFGFGDQFAYLNLLTKATTIDGSYHTARTISELRESGIGQVDTVYWALKGIPAIIPILQESGEYGVRWGFVNPATLKATSIRWGIIHRNEFVPVLEQLGWIKLKTLDNGVLVYENPKAKLPEASKAPVTKPIESFSWGVFPIFAFVSTVALAALRVWSISAEKVLRGIHAFIVGLIPLSLCFWYYQTIAEFPHDRVYFIYDGALLFLSDALAVMAVTLWLSAKIAQLQITNYKIHLQLARPRFITLLFALFLLSSFSILWSTDWRTSFYISLHLWLGFLLILSLRDWQDAWKPAMLGFCAALSFQFIAGVVEFATQSTAFLKPLQLNWPGPFTPSIRGVSVVQLADGFRILRAYGTTPHPNILGGFALLSLLGPASLLLANKKANYAALILFSLGIILMALTFSRSAWLGLIIFIMILILKSKHLGHRRVFLLVATSVLTITLTLYPLRELVFTRLGNSNVQTEQLSNHGRSWLNEQAMNRIRLHPFTGVGIGAFIIELGKDALPGASIEPVHNILLLAGAELGIFGAILVCGLFISIMLISLKAQTPESILASAMLAGLGMISLFDHYLWSLAPGRLMLALALGLWAGSIKDNFLKAEQVSPEAKSQSIDSTRTNQRI